MKYYLIAGEASGDLHGSNLIKSLIKVDPDAHFRYYGGQKMLAEGGELVKDYKDTAIMGFIRVALNAGKILRNIKDCKEDITQYAPDVLVLIDYPGFNLEIAKYAKTKLGLKVLYYIPPKLWAWKERRVEKIKKYVDKVYCIFPFEVEFYKEHGFNNVEYVGNPCVESVASAHKVKKEDFYLVNNLDLNKKIIAILPGSRAHEVTRTIDVVNKIDKSAYKHYQFVLAATSSVDRSLYKSVAPNITIVYDLTYPLLSFADTAIVNSGTATLETALFNVPQVVVFPMFVTRLLYAIGRKFLIKIKHISLVNIISERESVRELVAHDCKPSNVKRALDELLYDSKFRESVLNDYKKIAATLGNSIASDVAANDIIKLNA